MKFTSEMLIHQLGVTDKSIIKVVLEFQNKLPILTDDGEGFCVDARDLHRELKLKDEFANWIKSNLQLVDGVENVDYKIVFGANPFKPNAHNQEEMAQMSPQRRSAFGITTEYKLTLDCAKELAMITGIAPRVNQETKALSKLTRKYFITMEKLAKEMVKWGMIRKPEKENWNILEKELEEHYIRTRDELPKDYAYSREANVINKLVLGLEAKKLRKLLGVPNDITRDWLPSQYNEAIDFCQGLLIMFLRMDMQREQKYKMLEDMFKAKYPNLIPYKEVWEEKGKPSWDSEELLSS